MTAAAALVEFWMGRTWMCRCGYVKLWHGVVYSSENSQHLTDWYTFSHVLHGIGFYFLLWLAARRIDWRARLVMAVALEATWEVAENTPMIIDRYRAATIALDYYGDSIVNSVADIVAMALGFWIALKARALGERDDVCDRRARARRRHPRQSHAEHRDADVSAGVHQAVAARIMIR